MNVFYLSENPTRAAYYHCDKHIVVMPKESAQMICTNLHLVGVTDVPFKKTHENHPCTVWARDNRENFELLCEFMFHLSAEYSARYNRVHLAFKLVEPFMTRQFIKKFPSGAFTPPPQCMPEQFRGPSTVLAYREFYNKDKSRFAQWRYSEVPYWFKPETDSEKVTT